ncbi:MAG: DUF6498-containing protein [Propionicimonas sp.]
MIARLVSLAAYVAVPIVGLVLLGWDWRSVIILYWLENVTLGIRNVVAMRRTTRMYDPAGPSVKLNGGDISTYRRGPLIGFFVVHYGLFTFVHGCFVMAIVAGLFFFGRPDGGPAPEPVRWGTILLIWLVASAAHLVTDLLQRPDSLPAANRLFLGPYRRIVVLHVVILAASYLISAFGWPPLAALALVVLHAVIDLWRPLGRR